MPPRKAIAVAPPQQSSAQLEIGSLFEQELQTFNEDLRKQAAASMLQKLQPSNKMNVDQFLSVLKTHKEVWGAVGAMGIVEFADAINDGRRLREARSRPESRPEGKRTRLNEAQKQALKNIVVKVLADQKDGLNRNDIAKNITNDMIAGLGVDRGELANKLRQPLGELVTDVRIHTVGEKRLMKYVAGSGPSNKGKKS